MNHRKITDRDVRAAFLARSSGAPAVDLAERISAATASTRQSRPLISVPGFGSAATARLAWAAVLAALTLAIAGILALGVGRNPITSVIPRESPAATDKPVATSSAEPSDVPSDEPSVAPSQSASPASSPFVVAGLGPDTLGVVVATDGLRVRRLPTVGEESERLEPTLPVGVPLYVVDGPVAADGYAWYQVQPYGADEPLPFGWIAAGSRDGEPWIEQYRLGCDSVPLSPEGLASGESLEHLFCSIPSENENVPIPDPEVEGHVSCVFANVDYMISGPEWIEVDRYCEFQTEAGSFWLYGKPLTALLDEGAVDGRYLVVGHFDDPGASECRSTGGDGDAPDPAQVVLSCRTHFVVTEATPTP